MSRAVTDLTKDTVLCMSLAARPSNIGTRFHNYLYEQLGLNYVYKAFTTTDLPAAIAGIRALGIRGCAISMPYKEACIPLVDEMDESASVISSVNTVVNTAGMLRAYNTDYLAVAELLTRHQVSPGLSFAVNGAGGMAKAVLAALRDAGFTDGVVVARTAARGAALAAGYGYSAVTELGSIRPGLLVNATPIGMQGGPESGQLAFPSAAVDQAAVVFDVVALPPETPLITAARRAGRTVITGAEVIALQAAAQFELYTGVRVDPELVAQASEFSRQPL